MRMVASSGWSDPYTAEGRSNTADFCSQGSVSIATHMPTLVVVGRMDEGGMKPASLTYRSHLLDTGSTDRFSARAGDCLADIPNL